MLFSSVLSEIICSEFDKSFQWDKKNLRDLGMMVKFRINRESSDSPNSLQLFIWGSSNYIGAFVRVSSVMESEKLFLPDNEWHCLAYHDSCWRSDGVERLMRVFGNSIIHLDTLFLGERNWYQTWAVSELTAKHFISVRNARKDWDNYKIPSLYHEAEQEMHERASI